MLTIIGFLAISLNISGQYLKCRNLPIAFYSECSQAFKVIEGDSIFSLASGESIWRGRRLVYADDLNFQKVVNDYQVVNHSKGDYFVVNGCGKVYQIRNDSLVRIDHSFEHKNQFLANLFVYNDTIYMINGYGFFESTNISTYYDSRTKGWFLKTYIGKVPPTRSGAVMVRADDQAHFMGGGSSSATGFKLIDEVWNLDLSNWKWSYVSEKPLTSFNLSVDSQISGQGGRFFRDGSNLLEIDIKNNLFRLYHSDRFMKWWKIVESKGRWLCISMDHDATSYQIRVAKPDTFLEGLKCSTHILYPIREKEKWLEYLVAIFAAIVLMMLAYFAYHKWGRQGELQRVVPDKSILLQLSNLDKNILLVFFDAGDQGIEISDLNRFFEFGNPNFDAMKKRREMKIKELKIVLSQYYQLEINEVFMENRLESDRRMKKLYLNPAVKREDLGIS